MIGNLIRQLPRHAILIFYSLIILGPLSFVLFATFKTTGELYASPLSLPNSVGLDSYLQLFATESMIVYFLNSVVVTLISVFFILFFGSMLAYAIARVGAAWLAGALFAFFVGGLMIAPQVYMMPLFILMQTLGLVDSLTGVILVSIAWQIPIAVLILTGFMRSIPKDILDAAFVDGASEWKVYRKIVVPMAAPAFAALAIFSFVITYNDLLFPLLFLRSDANKTLPLALLEFKGQYVTNYPVLFSGVLVATIPMIIAYLFLQRYFIEGMTGGAMKG